jgi:hypothetical protein
MSGSSQNGSTSHHPGSITFVDRDAGTESVQPADQVPEGIAFCRGADGERIPVVRVVRYSDGPNIRVCQHGADGGLLKSTVMVPTEPYRRNVLPRVLSTTALLAATEAGQLVWARSDKGPIVKAGGSVPEGLHAGREIWLTLTRVGKEYQLALTSGVQPYGQPQRQRDGWFRRCELGRLWAAVERSLS